ncbi:hypothetical protein T07_11794, partial [Trichinella nelsoni]
MIWKQMQQNRACRKYNSTFEKIKVIHHSNVGITGTIRKNLQRATISYKHIQLHMEKKQVATICFIL